LGLIQNYLGLREETRRKAIDKALDEINNYRTLIQSIEDES